MNKLENFLEQLATAIAVKYFSSKHSGSLIKHTAAPKETLAFQFRPKVQGLKNCINCKQLTFKVDKSKPHCMLVTEVWFGYDGEGSHWSDTMGGVCIDCTGKKFQEAIDYITGKIWEDFKDLVR